MERTLVLLKPDSVQRNLSGELINRIEKIGFKIIGLKLKILDQIKAHEHYEEHKSKPFFNDLVSFINIMGSTNPSEASPGSIRGDFGISLSMNLIHGSDSVESAKRELKIFFEESELVDYNKNVDEWILE